MIEINWQLLAAQVVTFLVAMLVIWRLFWGPLTRLMQNRSHKISDDLERAEHGRREVEALEADYHQRLSKIEEHVRQEINQAIQEGNKAKEQILQEAKAEAQRILQKTKDDLALERGRVLEELRMHISDLSVTALERLLGQEIDTKTQKRLLEEFVSEVEKIP